MTAHNLRYFIREGFVSLRSHRSMAFAAVGAAVACLLMTGSVVLVAVNAAAALREQVDVSSEIVAYIDETYDAPRIAALEERLLSVPNVAEARFISKEEAMDSFKDQLPDEELFQDLNPEILNDRFALKLENPELLTETAAVVEGVPGVSWVRADEAVSGGVLSLRNTAAAASAGLIAVLAAVSVFIISNTVRLTTYSRREEIAIMRIVGASNGFIRGPFLFEGLYIGLFGALLAFFLQWGLYEAVSLAAADGAVFLPFAALWLPVLGAFLLSGILIGIIGSLTAIRKYLDV